MALQEILTRFGFDVDSEALDDADKGVDKLRAGLSSLGGVLAGGALALGVNQIFSFASEAAVATDALAKFGEATGLAAQEVAVFDQLGQDAGLELEQLRGGIATVTKIMGEAALGNEEYQRTFRMLGAELKDSAGNQRDVNDVVTEAIIGLDGIEDAATRAAIAERIFGEAGKGIIRISQAGAESITATREEFERLNPRYEETVAQAQEAAVALDGWRKSTDAAKNRLASAFIPILTRIVNVFDSVVRGILDLAANTKIFEVALVGLGAVAAVVAGAMLISFAPIIATVVAIAAAVLAVIVIIEDLVQLFSGGESVIGGFIDELFGIGAAQKFVDAMRRAWDALVTVFEFVFDLLRKLFSAWLGWMRFALRGWLALARGVIQFARRIGVSIRAAWDGLRQAWDRLTAGIADAWEAAFSGVRAAIDFIVDKTTAAITRIRELTSEVLEFLGLADDTSTTVESIQTAEAIAAQSPFAPRAADAARILTGPTTQAQIPAARGGGGVVSVTNSPVVNVNSSNADPSAVAREVVREIDRREQATLRRTRNILRR